MEYLRHPYFDASPREEWIELPLDRDGRPEPGVNDIPLADVIRSDFDHIARLVLDRIIDCMPDEWLNECPHPSLNELLFHPRFDTGIKLYLEYLFRPSLTENSWHTDSWWAIVVCPYAIGVSPTGRRDYSLIHLGWSVDWRE
jgi:hypothetical protein